MIISISKRFLFIKGRKVAGTSVEVGLSRLCQDDDILTPISPTDEAIRYQYTGLTAQNYGAAPGEIDCYRRQIETLANRTTFELARIRKPRGLLRGHMSIKEIEQHMGPLSDNWTIIAITRNPYDQVLSRIKYSAARMGADLPLNNQNPAFKSARSRFFERAARHKVDLNVHLYKDKDDTFRPNFILRYEALEQDFEKLVNQLGHTTVVNLPHLKKIDMEQNSQLGDLFSKSEIDIINHTFDEEFSLFEYVKL